MIQDIAVAAVIGFGRSGKAAVEALERHGVRVVVFDEGSPPNGADKSVVWNWDGKWPEQRFDLIVPSPGVAKTHPALVAATSKGVPIWSEPEVAYRIAQAPIWTVTGTNGKTTTTAMLGSIAVAAGLEAHLCGNIAARGVDLPLTRAALQADALDVLVAEISSFQLEWVATFRPRLAILTNVQRDHLTRYNGYEDYLHTKERIFGHQTDEDVAVIGCDSAQAGNAAVIRFGWSERDGDCAFVNGEELVSRRDGKEWTLGYRTDIQVPGSYNILNGLAAAAGAAAMGVPPSAIREGLRSFRGLPHRMEVIGTHAGITFVDNSTATNSDSCATTLMALERPTNVLIGGHDKELPLEPIVEACATLTRRPVIYGAVADRLGAEMRAAGVPFSQAGGLEEAFQLATDQAQSGDAVALIPGFSSFDAYRDFMDRADHFRRLVEEFACARC